MTKNTSHFHTIPQDQAPEILNLIIEIKKGSVSKYEYNHEYGILELDRVLYGPTHYPVNYCDVPGTWNMADDDPLDAVVFSTAELLQGTLVKGRVIGLMEMEDNKEKDPKVICIALGDPRYGHVKTTDDLIPFERKDLKTFMEIYKYAQTGPGTVKVGNFLSPEEAYKIINQSIEGYKEKFGER